MHGVKPFLCSVITWAFPFKRIYYLQLSSIRVPTLLERCRTSEAQWKKTSAPLCLTRCDDPLLDYRVVLFSRRRASQHLPPCCRQSGNDACWRGSAGEGFGLQSPPKALQNVFLIYTKLNRERKCIHPLSLHSTCLSLLCSLSLCHTQIYALALSLTHTLAPPHA